MLFAFEVVCMKDEGILNTVDPISLGMIYKTLPRWLKVISVEEDEK